MSIALRVAARFAAVLVERDIGRWHMHYLPQHVGAVDLVAKFLEEGARKIEAKGIPIAHEFRVELSGKNLRVAAEYIPTEQPRIRIAPRAFKNPSTPQLIVHELAHYVHDKVVSGGFENEEVERRYAWAMKQKNERPDDYASRFELSAHDWMPTSYARTNAREWFAEMLTSHIYGHLKPQPTVWLHSVIKNGVAPEAT